ncbi:MAG: methyl-accepting chemotaxis protein [Ghiorsea sp.]
MRNNQPVNQTEHRMQPGEILVSKTDLKGILTYVNEAFCQIAGMPDEQLIGQPHNVVRHPDMPSAAFADLWETVQAGKPWTGMVKNRSADGGFYWVKANAAPDFDENGQVIGYISVRTCPSQEEINNGDSLYKNVNAGKKTLPSSVSFSWLKRLSIKAKLLSVLIVATVTMLSLLWMLVGNRTAEIEQDKASLQGLTYAQQIRHLLEHLPTHRGMANVYLQGDKSLVSQINNTEQEINHAFEGLIEANDKFGESLYTEGMVEGIQKKWVDLSRGWKYLNDQESFAKHTEIIDDLRDLAVHTAGTSGFLSSKGMVASMSANVLSIQSLEMVEHLGRMSGLASGLVKKGVVDAQAREKLMSSAVSVQLMEEHVKATLSEAIEASHREDVKGQEINFDTVLENMNNEVLSFLKMIKKDVLAADKITISSNEVFSLGSQSIQASFVMFDEVAKVTRHHLETTVAKDENELKFLLLTCGLAVLFALILLVNTLFSVMRPLAKVTNVLEKIVANDYSTEIEKKQDDELGEVLDKIKITQSRLQFEIFEARNSAVRQREREEEMREEERREDLELANTFEADVGSLVTELSDNANTIHDSMESLSKVADDLNEQSQGASANVSQSSDYVGTTAAAIEEMSISVSSVVEQINATLSVSEQAVLEAGNSAGIMKELVTASEEIGSVVATISDIAEQTNLLALNASIEAARAGEAGRGFAVVAGEVKELANQTSQATGKIRSQVEQIQEQSKHAGDAIAKIQEIIEKVNAHSSHVATAMGQQSEATREMSSGAQYANSSMQDVQVSVGEVSSAATVVDDSAENNLKLVDEMIVKMGSMQEQVQRFVARLKS